MQLKLFSTLEFSHEYENNRFVKNYIHEGTRHLNWCFMTIDES